MKKIAFHPFLIGIYSALALFANNISQVEFSDTLRVFYASLLIILIVCGFSYFVLREWRKAALIASLVLIFFFSYGHVYSLLRGVTLGSFVIGRTLILLPIYLILVAFCSWWVLFRLKNIASITEALNIISLLLVAFPLYTISSYTIKSEMIRSSQQRLSNNRVRKCSARKGLSSPHIASEKLRPMIINKGGPAPSSSQ